MKVFSFFAVLILALACAGISMAQTIEPARISWKAGSLDVTIAEGLEQGIKLTDCYDGNSSLSASARNTDVQHKFSVECLFDVAELSAKYPNGLDCMVKWYFYMSTMKMLMFSGKITLSPADVKTSGENKGFVVLSSSPRLALRTGWWEVTITNINAKEDISFGGNDVFKVRLD